jgi:hypothetical protein
MKFKVGDKVRYVGLKGSVFEIVRIATPGEVIVGPWLSGNNGYVIPDDYTIVYIYENEFGKWSIKRVELEDQWELVTPEKDLDKEKLIKSLEMKLVICKEDKRELENEVSYYSGKIAGLEAALESIKDNE